MITKKEQGIMIMAAGTVRATKTTMRVEMQNDGHWGVC